VVNSPRDSCFVQLIGKPRVVSSDRRLSAPGRLSNVEQDADPVPERSAATPMLPDVPLAQLAAQYGLRPSAQRPPIHRYIGELWQRGHFILAYATARNIAMYTEARLGQLWQVLTPLLNVGVYWLIFGLLLDISKGIPDYIGFLVVGVFVFNYTQRTFITNSTVIIESLPLIRALRFPRACLPLAYVIIELEQMMVSMAVLIVIILALGEPITLSWLLAIPVLLLQTLFNVGVGLATARLGSNVNDFSQLLPFVMRTWMYLSGVLFQIATLESSKRLGSHAREFVAVLQVNPAALYITLMRLALLHSQRESFPGSKPYNKRLCGLWNTYKAPPYLYDSAYCHSVTNPDHYWYFAIGWAVLALVVGFIFFWRAEAKYGRG
jgi:teichoic acid transport system permease protein